MERCDGRCSGCAMKKGAKANLEVDNRITALFSALGGIPFFCHEALGWTPDRKNYPGGNHAINNAANNLMTAPKLIHNCPELASALSDCTASGVPAHIFDGDREVIGRAPICDGWKRAVAKLAKRGWFADPERRKLFRQMARTGLIHLEELKGKPEPRIRQNAIAEIGKVIQWFAKIQREVFGKTLGLEHK